MSSEIDIYTYCPQCANKLVLKTNDKQKVKACSACDFIFWNNPKPVVSILLHKDKKVLMLQRAHEPCKDYWVLPGGFMRYEETSEEAIRREAKEEIGIDIAIDGLVGVYRIDNDPRGIHIDIIFQGSMHDEVRLSKEDKKWQYFSSHDLPAKIAYKHREAITDWYTKGGKFGKVM